MGLSIVLLETFKGGLSRIHVTHGIIIPKEKWLWHLFVRSPFLIFLKAATWWPHHMTSALSAWKQFLSSCVIFNSFCSSARLFICRMIKHVPRMEALVTRCHSLSLPASSSPQEHQLQVQKWGEQSEQSEQSEQTPKQKNAFLKFPQSTEQPVLNKMNKPSQSNSIFLSFFSTDQTYQGLDRGELMRCQQSEGQLALSFLGWLSVSFHLSQFNY